MNRVERLLPVINHKSVNAMNGMRETFLNYILGILYPLRPKRLPDLPGLLLAALQYWVSQRDQEAPFPPIERARKRPDGLLMVGGKLTTSRLVNAYRHGIYPFCHLGPMKWWAPQERMVLFPAQTHIGKNLRRLLRRKPYSVTFDQAFGDVITACARPREGKTPLTWISRDVIDVYCNLFDEDYAHSVEVWDENKELVGGLYGVAIGRLFFTESQFALVRDTSRIALTYLNCYLQAWGYSINDCKHYTPHLESLGALLIPRSEFTAIVTKWCDVPGQRGPWQVDETLNVAEWRPGQANQEAPIAASA